MDYKSKVIKPRGRQKHREAVEKTIRLNNQTGSMFKLLYNGECVVFEFVDVRKLLTGILNKEGYATAVLSSCQRAIAKKSKYESTMLCLARDSNI